MKQISLVILAMVSVSSAHAAPDLNSVVAGQVGITQNSSQTLIRQTSPRAILQWNDFDIASDHSVIFQQPSSNSFILNRVIGSFSPTIINGPLSANGMVAIVNSRGMMIGPSGMIDTSGFIFSTSDILDADIMDGDTQFSFSSPSFYAPSLLMQGKIRLSNNGKIILQAPSVNLDHAEITGNHSNTVIAAADSIVLDLSQGLNQIQLVLGGGDVDIRETQINTNHGDLLIAAGNNITVQDGRIDAGEGNIDFIAGNTITSNYSLFQSSGGDVNFDVAYGYLYLDNSVIVTKGLSNSGNIQIETPLAGGFSSGSSDNFILNPTNIVHDFSENGGDIVIRAGQIYGAQNCIESGSVSCQFQGQDIRFSIDQERIEREKSVNKSVRGLQNSNSEKVRTFVNQSSSPRDVNIKSSQDNLGITFDMGNSQATEDE